MADGTTSRRSSEAILLELHERLSESTKLVDVNIAAGAARNELLGIDEHQT